MPARKPASADASATGTGTPPPPLRPKGRPRGFRRDRDCRTCKARNVKCDLNRPSCGICVEAGVTCQGYATTVRWANSTPSLPAGASSSSTSSARKSAAAAASVSSFSASPSCGPSPSPSLSHSSVPSPPDTIPNAYHNQQQQQQQLPLPSLDNSGSLMGNFISSLPGHPRSHGHSHSHPGAASAKFHNSTTTTMTTTTTTTPPLQVMPDQRARLLQAALEENPADSNWTTHYLKYYEFFTAQFAQARRAATKERRYRPDMVMISSSPDPDRQPLPPHLQEQQQPLLPQQQPCPVVDGDLKNVWLLLYQRISGQSAVADNNMDLLTSKAGALAEVKEAIRAGDILAIYGVVTLSFLDVYEGPFIDCQWHMLGAKALLQLHCHDLASLDALCAELPGLREAISLLSWYDTMGFYFEQDRRNALVFPDWVREAMHDDFFKLTSCPRDTYMVYAAVVKARTAHRGNREDGDVTPSPLILTSAESGLTGSPATGAIVGCPKVHQQQQRDTKLTMLGIQQILQTSHSKHGQDFLDQTSILNDCFRYAVALIAIETAYTTGDDDSSTAVDSETAATLAALTDRVCDKVLAGVPVNSGRYRHLACQVTILGHHARTQRHRDAVGGYWTRCDTLARPIYPNGRVISSVEEHWTRVLGTSKPS